MIIIRKVASTQDTFSILKIRKDTFCAEQNIPLDLELDDEDIIADHFIILVDDVPVGTCRVIQDNESEYRIGRVSIVNSYRKQGYGTMIMKYVEDYIALKNPNATIFIHSQSDREDYYAKKNYISMKDYHYEANIKHVTMYKKLGD